MKQIALVVVSAFVSLTSSGQDLQEQVSQAEKLLRSQDASERDRAEKLIEGIALKSPDLVRHLASDSDPEVKARSRRVLKRLHLLADSPEEQRAMDILDLMSTAQGDERDRLVRELLAIGEPAAGPLAAELENRALEPLDEPVAVREGEFNKALRVRVRNAGHVALWLGEREGSRRDRDFIGRRTEFLSSAPEEDLGKARGDRHPAPSLALWLSRATRIRAGGELTLDLGEGWPESSRAPQRRMSVFEGRRPFDSPVAGVLGGVEVQVPNDLLTSFPIARGIALQEQESTVFQAKVARGEGRIGLEVTALVGCDDVLTKADLDNFWFVALGKSGEMLDFGPMRDRGGGKKTWAVGETLTVRIAHPLPAAAVRVWLGFDWGTHPWETVVPAPLELSEAGSENHK